MRTLFSRLLVAATTAALLSGCTDLQAQIEGRELSERQPDSLAPPVLATEEWAASDGLVSVIVRNDDDRVLATAEVTLTGIDAEGQLVGTWGGSAMAGDTACCTVVDLGPGEEYGLYFAAGEDAERVDEVELEFANIAWGGVPDADREPAVTGTGVRAVLERERTVVRAVLDVGVDDVPRAVVQAILRGRSGKLIAVVTGRWSCLEAGTTRRIQMELFQPVPPGTGVDSVVVRPLEEGLQPSCVL